MRLLASAAAVLFAVAAAAAAAAERHVSRRPDRFWDHVVRGADVGRLGRRDGGAGGDDGLESYSLRAKKADPARLGVDSVRQYSGYLDDAANDKHLFYWFFESRNDPANDPVVLWLNGGPGCSSMVGLFSELGPAKIPNSDLKPVRNPYSWNSNASVIFLDQPVNTGFSYSGQEVATTAAASRDVYALLTLFFHEFPQYAKQDFHIAGESYAGHYIPVFAQEILAHAERNIRLKSVMMGNGLTDPLTQYRYYRPMACGDGGYPAVLGADECRAMDAKLPRCERMIQACYDADAAETCADATNYCNAALLGAFGDSGRSVYDVRRGADDGDPDYSTQFLNRADVMEALGSEVDAFRSCNMRTNGDFVSAGDWMKPIHRVVPGLLAQLPVLVYAGDADFICNWLGNRAWTEALEWPGHDAFNRSAVLPLRAAAAGAKDYGNVRAAEGFAFMRIFGAGHMVPADQPAASLDFFNRWIAGEWHSKR